MLRMLRKGEKATHIIYRLLSCLIQWRSLTLGKLEICRYNMCGSQSHIHTEKSRWHTKLYQLLGFDKTRALTAWEPTLPLIGKQRESPVWTEQIPMSVYWCQGIRWTLGAQETMKWIKFTQILQSRFSMNHPLLSPSWHTEQVAIWCIRN